MTRIIAMAGVSLLIAIAWYFTCRHLGIIDGLS